MENYIDCRNEITLQGEIVDNPRFSHESFNQVFYTFDLKIPRLSGNVDVLPIVAPKYVCDVYGLSAGMKIGLNGQFRSYNQGFDGYKSKLVLSVYLKELYEYKHFDNTNTIELAGYICKPPVYRKTPFGREITDFMLAVNRGSKENNDRRNRKTDYIPCIAWGNNARLLSKMVVSNYISFLGRIQSREYSKVLASGRKEERKAYEVSINDILSLK